MIALPILIIEDDPDQLTLLVTMLRDEAYDLITADSGRQGLELLNKMVPTLVVTDIVMDDVSGENIVKAMRHSKRLSLTPIIVVTSNEHFVTPEIRQLVNKVMVKPVQKATLVQTIHDLLRQKPTT
jgi:DNA-binding response OmpR family regulator